MPFRDAIREGWHAVRRSKRLVLSVALLDVLVAAPAAVWAGERIHAAAAHRVDAIDVARRFDPDFFSDLRDRGGGFDEGLTALVAVSLAVFFLARPLVAGGYTGGAAWKRRLHLSLFLKEGGAVYWKFLRLSCLGVAALYLLSLAARPLLKQIEEWALERPEPTAIKYRLVTQAVVFAAFCLVAVLLEYARVGIRLQRRPGVLAELVRSALFVLQHPLRTLGFFAFAFAIEAAVVAVFAWIVRLADGAYLVTSAVNLVLVLLLAALREAARLFHVAGAWHIRARELGEERRVEVVVPEREEPDLLRAPLPWR